MKDKDIQLIEDYIDGNLTGNDLTSCEQRLATDKTFAKAYRQRKQLALLWNETKEYQATKQLVKDALGKRKQGFFIAYRYHLLSVAASIVILIGGYFLLLNERGSDQNGVGGIVATNEAETEGNTIQFKVDKPNHLAAIDTVNTSVRLIYPIAGESYGFNDPITFKWETDLDLTDTILIKKDSTNTVLSKTLVNLSDSTYTMKYPELSKGHYIWNLATGDQIGKFSIIDDK